MCGIVGAIAERNVTPILVEGLKRLEYRGYDSAGVAVLEDGQLRRARRMGKVQQLQDALEQQPLRGGLGIAHTRWATHGAPSEANAHPHISGDDLAVVHNGIIENHDSLRTELQSEGFRFTSDTDTEVVAHRIRFHMNSSDDLLTAVQRTVKELEGAYALVVMSRFEPDRLIVARSGCPLVIGLGIDENFVASDALALVPVTRRFVYLAEGDVGVVDRHHYKVYDVDGNAATRPATESDLAADSADRGPYRHFMLKEIHEQPAALASTFEERLGRGVVLEGIFGHAAADVLRNTKAVQIVACGTSYHAGLIARYQIEELARLPCSVEIASEYRYRRPVVSDGTLFVTISQSGETADTLAALQSTRQQGFLATLAICNVPESSIVRASDLVLMTRAGPEIGVASTKAFTTQLAALALLTITLARHRGMKADVEADLVRQLETLPGLVEKTLTLDAQIARLAEAFAEKRHALFLGRGALNPVAMEGALKLKEISYIHAEAYPAGELKHGPLALVDDDMPVITVAPNNDLLEKLKSNLQEVRARGGQLFVFADPEADFGSGNDVHVVRLPESVSALQAPIVYTIPLQLLAYHVAVLKGTDVDQPRNLAKSVTVE